MIYETAGDRAAQRQIAKFVRDSWFPGVLLYSTKPLTPFDYTAYRDNTLEFVIECKDRKYNSTDFEKYMIDKKKILVPYHWSRQHHCDFVLAVRWTDNVVGIKNVNKPDMDTWEVGPGGRKDRSDPDDLDTCFFIPINSFDRRIYVDRTAENSSRGRYAGHP